MLALTVPTTSNATPGLAVPIPTFPAKYAFPVVVAPPLIVNPVVCPPAPMVEEAYAVRPPAKEDAVVDVAVNEPESALLPRSDEPVTESVRHGVLVPMPTLPPPSAKIMLPLEPIILNAEVVVVAVPATVVVAKYKFPPAFLNAHCAFPAPAESASWEAVAENGLRSHCGVVVPMPTLPFI